MPQRQRDETKQENITLQNHGGEIVDVSCIDLVTTLLQEEKLNLAI
jgi:hypothetical protein